MSLPHNDILQLPSLRAESVQDLSNFVQVNMSPFNLYFFCQ